MPDTSLHAYNMRLDVAKFGTTDFNFHPLLRLPTLGRLSDTEVTTSVPECHVNGM
jgi:hypothetical protein